MLKNQDLPRKVQVPHSFTCYLQTVPAKHTHTFTDMDFWARFSNICDCSIVGGGHAARIIAVTFMATGHSRPNSCSSGVISCHENPCKTDSYSVANHLE